MTFEIAFVLLLIVAATILFVTDYVSYDLVAIIVMVSLLITGILTPREGLSGFSNPATVTVAAMFILSEGVRRTGILNSAGDFFSSRMQENFAYWFLSLLIFIGVISAFINNTAAVAIFIPVMMTISSRVGVSPSKLLIPLSFAGMFGGVCTLIGTSTNILVSSIAVERGMDAIGMFEFTGMGLIFLASGLLFLFTFGMKMIPDRRKEEDLTKGFDMQEYLTDIVINPGSQLIGKTLDHKKLTSQLDLDVIRVFKPSVNQSAQRGTVILEEGDILRIRGNADEIKKLLNREDVTLRPEHEWFDVDLEHGRDAVVEAVVAPESALEGARWGDFDFYEKLGAVPLAIRHRGELKHDDLAERRLSGGDSLLLSMNSERLAEIESSPSLLMVSEPDILSHREDKTAISISIIAGVVLVAALGFTSIVISAIAGVVLMVLTGCLKTNEAYDAVNWKVVMLLAGVLPLGTAMDKTGTAELMAGGMIDLLAGFGPTVLMSGFFFFTLIITAVMSNNASAALLAPIAIKAAETMEVAPEPFLYAVTFAASLSLITPFGYQTNTMIYGPGRYEVIDFFKIGVPLNLLFWVLATIFIPLIWPF
ncbi:SLC13/DASS family transporter [Rhodohalobacter sp. SW132]|uniref:SLC13 family permease n=1 Tax=Rhodohalobacter sp. SW132 TaxID=2293433 RepID=UPI000E238101|nr:SLC13 family permease [Rhodohalobacter sp. SW132]REL25040.1 SLC13/DASS family transporter [Rhodohalobacter sp. SW132]